MIKLKNILIEQETADKTFLHDAIQKRVYDALNAKGVIIDEPTGNTDIKDVESGMGAVKVGDATHKAYIDLKKYGTSLGAGTSALHGASQKDTEFDPFKLLKKPILIAKMNWHDTLPSEDKTMIPISSIKDHLIGAGVIESVTYRSKGFAKYLVLKISDQMNPQGAPHLLTLGINPETGDIAQPGMPFGPKGYQRRNYYKPAPGGGREWFVLGITSNGGGYGAKTTIRKTTQGQRVVQNAKGETKVYTGK